jgi:hypothetical protein
MTKYIILEFDLIQKLLAESTNLGWQCILLEVCETSFIMTDIVDNFQLGC